MSRISVSRVTLPLSAGSVSSWVDRLDLLAAGGRRGCRRCRRSRSARAASRRRPGSNSTSFSDGSRLARLGMLAVVELLHVAQADQPRDHPVGAAPHVAAGVLATLEERAHLGVELVVVVVVLGVVDLDAGLLGERVERGARLLVVGRRRCTRVQFDQLTTFSVSLRSLAAAALGAAEPDAAVPLPALPQAASAAVAPRPSAPVIRDRRVARPRSSAARMAGDIGSGLGARPSGFSSYGGGARAGWGQRAGSGVSGVFVGWSGLDVGHDVLDAGVVLEAVHRQVLAVAGLA